MYITKNSTLLVATKNIGKVKEIKQMLEKYQLNIVSAIDLDVIEPEETGLTFESNSQLKAVYYAKQANLMALADDSGLCIDDLDGRPGIYAARWIKQYGGVMGAINEIHQQLEEKKRNGALLTNKAKFVASLTLANPNGEYKTFTGIVEGTLAFPPRGELGFGYDPLFIPIGSNKTFSEMNNEEKYELSHRTKAFNKFIQACLV